MTLSEREKDFKAKVFTQPFPADILQEFYEYWTEPNKSLSKLRFELERTWDLNRRLKRWERIRDSRPDFTRKEIARTAKPLEKIPVTELEKLEVFYTAYSLKPTSVPFELFGQWFEFMKGEAMLKELNQDEKDMLKLVYGRNAEKLRCAWVQKTLDHFFIVNYRFNPPPVNQLKAV